MLHKYHKKSFMFLVQIVCFFLIFKGGNILLHPHPLETDYVRILLIVVLFIIYLYIWRLIKYRIYIILQVVSLIDWLQSFVSCYSYAWSLNWFKKVTLKSNFSSLVSDQCSLILVVLIVMYRENQKTL